MATDADNVEDERTKVFQQRLKELKEERDAIINLTHPDIQMEVAELNRIRDERMKVASDQRDYNLADVLARARSERMTARSEFNAAKDELRQQMLISNGTLRRRVEVLRNPRSSSRRRRPSSLVSPRRSIVRRPIIPNYLSSLERQGILRLALSPDEINADLAAAVRSVDVARTRAMPHGATAGSSALQTTPDAFLPQGERVHTSRGTLHFYDKIFEKGDTIAVYPNKPGSVPKYHGVIQVINKKEVVIRSGESSQHKLNVQSLKKGSYFMKLDPTGNSLRTARLTK